MHPSKDDTNATKRKDLVHHFSASTVNPKLFVFMEDIISDYCHETSITRYPTLIMFLPKLNATRVVASTSSQAEGCDRWH